VAFAPGKARGYQKGSNYTQSWDSQHRSQPRFREITQNITR
jgi:hypothetical protein